MTDRLKGFIVVLGENIRDDDAEPIINAIKQIKGVLDVVPQVAGPADEITSIRNKAEFARRLHNLATEILAQ